MDVQEGFNVVDYWGSTSNPSAERRVADLVRHWRQSRQGPVVLVRHDSLTPESPLHPSHPGNRLQSFLDVKAADLLIAKSVNSAFYGQPDLRAWLDSAGVNEIVLCGIQTNMCVETTARMGGNLGYKVTVALDATRTFDLTSRLPDDGELTICAGELMRTTAVNLQAGGFARICTTAELISPN